MRKLHWASAGCCRKAQRGALTVLAKKESSRQISQPMTSVLGREERRHMSGGLHIRCTSDYAVNCAPLGVV
eukprot:359498-Chlamydomonas_euryale.AAC.3